MDSVNTLSEHGETSAELYTKSFMEKSFIHTLKKKQPKPKRGKKFYPNKSILHGFSKQNFGHFQLALLYTKITIS